MQSAQSEAYERVKVDMRLDGGHGIRPGEVETKAQTEVRYHTPEEEIAWVWPLSSLDSD